MTAARLEFTILGCGSSGGVPRIGNNWGNCDPEEPKNRRLRCSLLIRRITASGVTTVLVDTGPDMREQLLTAGVTDLDAVIYTHAHADHIHGIDDLRALAIAHRRRISVYMDEPTSVRAHQAFGYCFKTPPGSNYPPILDETRIDQSKPFSIDGAGGTIGIKPILVGHGDIDALGFRVGNIAYLPDVKEISPEAEKAFTGLDIWILDALRSTPHPSHFSLYDALDWLKRLAPRRAILTNMHIDLDYAGLLKMLPEGVEPAYDMLKFDIEV